MATKLGEMLVEAGRLTAVQLDEALKNQVVFGGRLGTNLIELGFLEEDEVAEFLSRKMGLPCASSDQLMSVAPEVIRLIPRELAVKYHIIPLNLDKKRLSLAMLDPSDLPLMDEISFVTGYLIIPLIVPELRMVLALERHYGVRPDARYVQHAERIRSRQQKERRVVEPVKRECPKEPSPPARETRREIIDVIEEIMSAQETAVPDPLPPQPREEDLADASSLIVEPVAVYQVREEAYRPPPGEIEKEVATAGGAEPVDADAAGTKPVEAAAETGEGGVKSAEDLADRLAESKDREDIADLMVSYLGEEFDRVALFMIKGSVATGWRGVRGSTRIPSVEEVRIPLERPSILKLVADSKSFYLGSIPETPENTTILEGIGGNAPASALLLPLTLMGRVVAILYMEGGLTPLSSRIAHLQKIVGKASMAFEILILKNKILMT